MNTAKILKPRRGSKSTMETSPKKDIILAEGEFFVEDDTENEIFRLKIGDGTTTYENLPYAISGDSFDLKFNPASSGLTSTNVESAIKELKLEEDATMFTANGFYGTCATTGSTAAKVATVADQGFALRVGVTATIKYTYDNTASNCTININNTGAFPIYYDNAAYTGSDIDKCGGANKNITYIFDGTYWVWISSGNDAGGLENEFLTESEYELITPDPDITYFVRPDPVTSQV